MKIAAMENENRAERQKSIVYFYFANSVSISIVLSAFQFVAVCLLHSSISWILMKTEKVGFKGQYIHFL